MLCRIHLLHELQCCGRAWLSACSCTGGVLGVRKRTRTMRRIRTNAKIVLAQFKCTATSRLRSRYRAQLADFKTLAFYSLLCPARAAAAKPHHCGRGSSQDLFAVRPNDPWQRGRTRRPVPPIQARGSLARAARGRKRGAAAPSRCRRGHEIAALVKYAGASRCCVAHGGARLARG